MATNSHEEFRDSLIKYTEGKYIFAGNVILNVEEKIQYKCEVCAVDSQIKNAFGASSQGRISVDELEQIDKHNSVVYITYENTGLEYLHHLHNIINFCLNIGGLGVKFENSGLSHSKNLWNSYNFHEDTLQILNTHVMFISDEEYISSVGMHIFGLQDVSISSLTDNPTYLLTEFNHYHLFESAIFKDGSSFSLSVDEPKYSVSIKTDFIYKGEDCFENPFGRILLN
ncbi:MAG: hypothetical protein HRU38_20145 [Saccharospirillaceae bacterium]|nr:hypothetical protein [Pseudomonadales bacterium]NRB80944.1 hypothetical protein [Saccharospirillaceae bacterium]